MRLPAVLALAAPERISSPPASGFTLLDRADVERFLNQHMPGDWSAGHITKLANLLPGQRNFARSGQGFVPTSMGEYAPLLQLLRWELVNQVWDPCAGSGATSQAFAAHRIRVIQTDIIVRTRLLDAVINVFNDADVSRFSTQFGSADAIVASCWFAQLDLMLPILLNSAQQVLCLHVPGHYFGGPEPRLAFLQRLHLAGRVAVIYGLPRDGTGTRCSWLLIFRSAAARTRLWRGTPRSWIVFHARS